MTNILWVSASAGKNDFEWKTPGFEDYFNSVKDVKIDCLLFEDNKDSIPVTYNKALRYARSSKDKSYDYIVFIHNDVKIPDFKAFYESVKSGSSKYSLMGFAGSSELLISETPSPLAWWLTAKVALAKSKKPCIYGKIFHPAVDKDKSSELEESFFNSWCPEVKDHEAACIDGLCMVFGKNMIGSDVLFDESFKNDFYDMDISLQAILIAKEKVGVLVVPMIHYSHGMGIMKQEFLEEEAVFRKKWSA